MTPQALVWNRACEGGGSNPHRGDLALAAMLRAHGLTMNGGVLHAVESLGASEVKIAVSGYRFFGLNSVAELFERALHIFRNETGLGALELILDRQYATLISDDSFLLSHFERYFELHAPDFAPI